MDFQATWQTLLNRLGTRTTTRDLAVRLAVIAAAVLALTGLAIYAVIVNTTEHDLNQRAEVVAAELAEVVAEPLQTRDLDTLSRTADIYRQSENLAGLVIADQSGAVLYQHLPSGDTLPKRTRSIYAGEQAIGQVEVWLAHEALPIIRKRTLAGVAAGILGVSLGILAATHLLIRRYLGQPLQQLARGIDHITAGHYSEPVAPVPQADINAIIDKVNAMARQIGDHNAELHRREEEFRQVVTSISDHIYLAEILPDSHFVPRYVSPSLERLIGYPVEMLLNDGTFWRQRVVWADDQPAVLAAARRQAAGGNTELEYRLKTSTGQIVWVRDSTRVEAAGAVRRVYGVISDITQRKRAEQVQAATYRISEATLTARSLDELYGAMHAIVGELMPAQNFYIALYHQPTHLIHFAYHADERDTGWEPIAPDRTLTGRVLQTGRSLLITRQEFEQMFAAGEVDLVGPPSEHWLGVPLNTQKGAIGVMAVHTYSEAPGLGEADRDILTFVSNQVAMAIERRQAQEALRLDEARLDALARLNEMTDASERAITDFALAEAVRLTKSTIGYLGRLSETEDCLTIYSWSGTTIPDLVPMPFMPLPATPGGSLGQLVRQRKPVVVNQPPANGSFEAGPVPGHVPVRRHILVPAFEGQRIVMVAAVGNKDEPYDDADVRQLTLLMEGMWRLLQRRRAVAQVRELNASLERRVQERTAQLTAANQELEAFAYSVSHDLRGPLRAINGFSQALLEDHATQLEPDAQGMLHRVRAATERMAQLIDDLLKLSRITRSEIQLVEVDLCQLVREAAAELRAAHPDRQVTVTVPGSQVVRADANLMRIALDNLLDNAWKFTRQRAHAQIEFGLNEQAGRQIYFVRDNGAGFEGAYGDKLFGAFQRLHTAGEFEGTGIGLAIVQRIIRRHGGQVWAEGAVDQGATFYFTLGE